MNRTLIGIVGAALILSGASFAKAQGGGGHKHPNITAAHNHLKQAQQKITAAQTANEFDMEGHAAKAKELIDQAEKELAQAREAANRK